MARKPKKKNLESVQDELAFICESHGGVLRPRDVVEFARDSTTHLHAKFEWDDDAAAEAYRIWQARRIIRVTVITLPQTSREVNAFVSLSSDRKQAGGGYRSTAVVLTDDAMRATMLADAMRELHFFREKYKKLTELSKVFAVIDETLAESRVKAA